MNEAEKNMWRQVREKWRSELREAAQMAHALLFPNADHIQSPSPPPTRESLLEWARSTRDLLPVDRRHRVLMVIEHSLEAGEPPCSVAEIFEAAYGDQAGREYWRLWLKYESEEGAVAKLLATHFVAESAERPDAKGAIAANPAGWSWEAQCALALGRYPSGQLADRVRSIVDDEELGYVVAPSLRAFLVGSAVPVKMDVQRNVAAAELTKFLKTMPKRTSKSEMQNAATDHFKPRTIPTRLFTAAYKELPDEWKRQPGETDRTIARRDNNTTR
jgi:hypothetical protein